MKFASTQSLCLLLVSTIAISITRAQVRCIAGTFERGERGNVSCHFSQDVRESQSNFNVVQYSSKPGDSGNYVLLCNWQDKTPQCKVEDGYAFDQQASQSVVVDIPKVTNNMAGMYACQIVPDDGKGITTCTLVVTETTTPIITTIAEPSRATSYAASRIQSQASNKDQWSNEGNLNPVIVAALAVFVIGTLVLGTILAAIWWKCSLKRRAELSPGEHDAWDEICCRPLQRLRKPEGSAGGGSPSKSESPEEEKLNPRRGDRSLPFDDVDDTDENNTLSFTASAAKPKQKSSPKQKENQYSTPPEQRREDAIPPSTQPANTSVPAASPTSSNSRPVLSHFERSPKGNVPEAERLQKENGLEAQRPPKIAEHKDLSSAQKSGVQTYHPGALTDTHGFHPLMDAPATSLMYAS